MLIYFIIFIILTILLFLLKVWILKLLDLFKSGKKGLFWIQILPIILLIMTLSWQHSAYPFAGYFQIKAKTTALTGKKFMIWRSFNYKLRLSNERNVSFKVYKINQKMADYFQNPDSVFFSNFPPTNLSDIKWAHTPINNEYVGFGLPAFETGSDEEMQTNLMENIIKKPGAYYSYQKTSELYHFYLISPNERKIFFIENTY